MEHHLRGGFNSDDWSSLPLGQLLRFLPSGKRPLMVKGASSRVPGRTHRAQFGGAARLFSNMVEYAFNCLSALGLSRAREPQRVTSPQRQARRRVHPLTVQPSRAEPGSSRFSPPGNSSRGCLGVQTAKISELYDSPSGQVSIKNFVKILETYKIYYFVREIVLSNALAVDLEQVDG